MSLYAFRKERLYVLVGTLITICTSVLHANEVDSVSKHIRSLGRVTVNAKRSSQKISVAMPTQVLTSKTMQDLGLQGLADAVRRMAGVTVKDYGGIGGLKTVSVRGLGAEHTAVSYDGVVVSNCQAGQIDISRFNLDDVETLTFSVGQHPDLLQSARMYASAGVLSLQTKNPLEGKDKPFSIEATLKGGSFGMLNPSIRWAQRLAERTAISLNGNYLRADGRYPFTLINGKNVTQEKRHNSDVSQWNAEGNVFHTFKDQSRLTAKVYYYESERGLPGSVILYNNLSKERLWDKNAFVQTKYNKTFSTKWRMQAEGKYNYSWSRYEDTNVKYQGGKQTDVNKQQEYYLSASVLWTPLECLSISWANDGAYNTLQSNLPNNPQPERWTWLSALNARWQWKWFTLTGTLVNTFATERVELGDCPSDRKRLSPSFSFMYRPFLSREFYLRLMYKDTFRVPTFNDMYYDRIGNTALLPEKAQEYNVGLTWRSPSWKSVDFISLTVDGYYNKVTNKIIAMPSMYVWRMMNYGRVDITGVDVSLQSRFNLFDKAALSLSAVYAYQDAVDLSNAESKTYKHQIPYTPMHSGNVGAIVETAWVNVGYSVVLVGERYCLRQNNPKSLMNSYHEHTLSLSHTFDLDKCDLRLQVEAVNLTDEQYDVIRYYPMPGRSFRGTINVKF